MKLTVTLGKFTDSIFDLVYVDKYNRVIKEDDWNRGTWKFKHRYLAPILITLALPFLFVYFFLGFIIQIVTNTLDITIRR